MTFEDYKRLINEYIAAGIDDEDRIRWTLLNGNALRYAEEIGKYPIEWNTSDLYVFFTEKIILSTSTAMNYIITMGTFYDYQISQGRIFMNPCNSAVITTKNILSNAKVHRKYYTDDDIQDILSSYTLNEELNTAILLSYYEGIACNAAGLAALRLSGFNPRTNRIETKSGVKKVSQRLGYAYRALAGIEYVDGDKPVKNRTVRRRTKAHKEDPDDLFPTTGQRTTFFNRRLEIIGELSGHQLNCYDLYYSGFVNFIANKIGEDRCVELILGNSNSDYTELCGYADDYLFQGYYNKIRGVLRGTALAMKERSKSPCHNR